jgi:hypothetical protein
MKTHIQADLNRRTGVWACCIIWTSTVSAQTVVNVSTLNSAPTAASSNSAGRSTQSPASSSINSLFSPLPPFASWGKLSLRPRLDYQFVYGSGILRVPGAPVNTKQQSITLSLPFQIGKYWSFHYAADRTWYSTPLIADSTGQSAELQGQIVKGDWTVGASQSYRSKSVVLVETGQQTPEVSYSTGGSVAYQLTRKTFLDVQMSRNTRESKPDSTRVGAPIPDIEQWAGTGTMHYRFSPRLDVGVGVRFGYDSFSNSSDMNISEPQVTINWRPRDKFKAQGQAGRESRKFKGQNERDLHTEVYSWSTSYQPTKLTSLSLSGNRRVAPSYFANQVTTSTGKSVSIEQRAFRHIFLSAALSEGRTNYVVIDQGFTQGRKDRFRSVNFNIGTAVLTKGSISIFYLRSKNFSNDSSFTFTSDQIGTSISYHF